VDLCINSIFQSYHTIHMNKYINSKNMNMKWTGLTVCEFAQEQDKADENEREKKTKIYTFLFSLHCSYNFCVFSLSEYCDVCREVIIVIYTYSAIIYYKRLSISNETMHKKRRIYY
jgi:hypothetical protein